MLVSIIIPCYNNEKVIAETIDSALSQSYKSIEIIVVNDGSTDDSAKVVENISTKYSNISFYSKENRGPSHTRNFGAQLSNGKFLVFLDGDDKLHTNYIQKCVAEYLKNPHLNIVYSHAEFFGSKSGNWNLPDYRQKSFLIDNCIPIFAMIKRDVFFDVGQFDENINFIEDWELWIRILKKYPGVYKIPETLFYYRKSGEKNSLTDLNEKQNDISDNARLYIYNKHYTYYKENGFSISNLITSVGDNLKYKEKYYSIWYRKYFYKYFKPSKYKNVYLNFL